MDDLVYLTEADVRHLLDLATLRARLRDAFGSLSAGKADVPPRIAARTADGLLAAMPGHLEGVGLVLKAVSVFPGNHGTDVPSHQGLILVFDERTGTPLAVMDAASVTALRTAASAAVAADLLARPDATVLAIVGGGVQGHSHLQAFADLRPWSQVRVASRSKGSALALAARHPSGAAVSFEEAVRGADVICLTTDADHPVIEPEWVAAGAHVGSVGNRAELHPGLARGTVFVEWMGAAASPPPAGAVELQGIDLGRVVEIGRVVNGDHPAARPETRSPSTRAPATPWRTRPPPGWCSMLRSTPGSGSACLVDRPGRGARHGARPHPRVMVRHTTPTHLPGGTVKTKAAILRARNTPWSVEEIELDPPKAGEVLVKIIASGMCHSDEHLVTGDLEGATAPLPTIGGHEGAGIVLEVGPGVFSVAPGDHVVFGFVPACGRCPSCASGHSNLCDLGAITATGMQLSDGTSRHHDKDGNDLTLAIGALGTFAHHTVVHEASCIKIEKDLPLDKACLLGCGVVTGWGSAVYAADVQPGDMVAVVGCGGIGSNAIQGAKMAGASVIAAIDPIEFKREKAMEFGATVTHASIQDALAALPDTTWSRGFDKVIMTCGVGNGDVLGEAFWLGGKRSKIVVTNIHPVSEASIAIPAVFLTVFEKQLIGSLFGSGNPRKDIPRLLELYTQGQLDLDGLVTRTYPLEGINDGYAAMNAGENIRGVLVYEHD